MEECLKLTLLQGGFSGFSNCTNGTKLRNASHIFLRLYMKTKQNIMSVSVN